MAKKKVTPHSQSQSTDPKKLSPPTLSIDDPSVQIQNLKNLNSVLLKETTNHRNLIESLLTDKNALQSALDRSAMDTETLISDKNITSELEKGVLFAFAETQMNEMGHRFDRFVGESNERLSEVSILKKQVSDLTIRLEKSKLLLSTVSEERDQIKGEAENRVRKVKEEVEKMELEAEKLFEEKREKERTIVELQKERDLAERNSKEMEKVISELKEKIDAVKREKNEVEMLNTTQGKEIFQFEREVGQLNELLENLRNQERLMCAKILELEDSLGLATGKVGEMENKNEELLRENKGLELNVKVLTEEKDRISRVLDNANEELESLRSELVDANRAREEIEKVKISRENEVVELQGEINGLRGSVDTLEGRCREFERNNEQLLSQVHQHQNALDEVELEKENIRKGFDEEKKKVERLELQVEEMEKKTAQLLYRYKNDVDELKFEKDTIRKEFDEEKIKVENLKLQVAGMEEKIEQAEAELGQMRGEKVKLNEINKKLESHVDVLVKEKDELQGSLVEAEQKCNDLKAKFESSSINSKQALELLRSTASLVSKDNAEEVVANAEEEIHPYAEELKAIRKAFKIKNEMVVDMKQQLVSMQKSVAEANKGKSLWTGMFSATTILAAALTTYIAKSR